MLWELGQLLQTRCKTSTRKLGYHKEAIGTASRQKRCKSSWQMHMDLSKEAILDTAKKARQRRTALVLGSGILCDVPYEELSRMFEKVLLVDIVHLPYIQKKTRENGNIHIIQHDITEVVDQIVDIEKGEGLPFSKPTYLLGDETIDCVVSVNILSQLPVVPMRHLEELFSEAELETFANHLISAHVEYLKSFKCATGLITEVENLAYDKNHKLVATEPSLYGVSLPKPNKEWLWDIAPTPELHRKYSYCNHVNYIAL